MWAARPAVPGSETTQGPSPVAARRQDRAVSDRAVAQNGTLLTDQKAADFLGVAVLGGHDAAGPQVDGETIASIGCRRGTGLKWC